LRIIRRSSLHSERDRNRHVANKQLPTKAFFPWWYTPLIFLQCPPYTLQLLFGSSPSIRRSQRQTPRAFPSSSTKNHNTGSTTQPLAIGSRILFTKNHHSTRKEPGRIQRAVRKGKRRANHRWAQTSTTNFSCTDDPITTAPQLSYPLIHCKIVQASNNG